MRQSKNKRDGRLSVMLTKNKEHRRISVHRLVAIAFVDNPQPTKYREVNHKDENPANNNADNLEWCDRKYNMNYNGLQMRMHDKIKTPVEGYLDDDVVYSFRSQREAMRNGFHVGHYLGTGKKYKGLYWRYSNERSV